jgi:putative ABC transport system substrate-binding protein
MGRLLAGTVCLALLLVSSGMAVAQMSDARHRIMVADAGTTRIAVVYPDIGEPYRSVFEQIVSGIEDKAGGGVAKFAVGQQTDAGELKSALRGQGVRVVIALGHQGARFAASLDRDIGVVVGGIIAPLENELRDVPMKSLSPDPALLFGQLKELMPGARRVFAVYDPRQNGWLIRLAKEAARERGMELVAYEAPDLRSAAAVYQKIFASIDEQHDALWLLQDSIGAENGTVLPMVLQESWSRNLVVFSSSVGHVGRGALFSLYPDNAAMGRHLADLARAFISSGDHRESGMILLREVLMAINLRTADHLGLRPGKRQTFGMVFPEQ